MLKLIDSYIHLCFRPQFSVFIFLCFGTNVALSYQPIFKFEVPKLGNSKGFLVISSFFLDFCPRTSKNAAKLGGFFMDLENFQIPQNLVVFFWSSWEKSKKASWYHGSPLNSPNFDTSNMKINSQLWATDAPNHFMT